MGQGVAVKEKVPDVHRPSCGCWWTQNLLGKEEI